jgi:hypothetical protein
MLFLALSLRAYRARVVDVVATLVEARLGQ